MTMWVTWKSYLYLDFTDFGSCCYSFCLSVLYFFQVSEETVSQKESFMGIIVQTLLIFISLGYQLPDLPDKVDTKDYEGCRCYEEKDSVHVSVNHWIHGHKDYGDTNTTDTKECVCVCFKCFCCGEISINKLETLSQKKIFNA